MAWIWVIRKYPSPSTYSNSQSKPTQYPFKCFKGPLSERSVDLFWQTTELWFGSSCTGEKGTFECVQKPRAWFILPPVLSSEINTRNSFSFKYGTVEISAKLPEGHWIYPSNTSKFCPSTLYRFYKILELYLTPKNNAYGEGLDSGRIVIAFAAGNADNNRKLSGGCVLGGSDGGRSYAMKVLEGDKDWSDGFHTFKLVWTPGHFVVTQNKPNVRKTFVGLFGRTEKLEESF